ncbi:PQQ-binding-like beta-propeller repeat protein [Streptomyces sp. ISL-98]|uniref:PQQ-binding-like beta-propeller repeat protein n=1 Tax=Streptomyces sp. ISL-98 TaxID=2819192 RepID=UPI001BEAE14A|nr:PQQ-binding-like beta-propeller repeat protein [Streptomyces sp. ISL-98]MBT2511472.1 PQQ-binding-like beta-propeller repeat protein [Streptomyces sp. ISL-98]
MSFGNIFDGGGSGADSAKQSAEALNKDTPGAGDVSEAVRKMESERDPWLVRQTAHGAFDVMGFLNPLFQKFHDASADQRQVSEDPASTSAMASSTLKAAGPPKVSIGEDDMPKLEDLSKLMATRRSFALITTGLGTSEGLAVDPSQNTAYVADRGGQKLSAVKIATGAQRVVASSLGDIGDVKLDRKGKAYTTDYGARLLAVDLSTGTSSTVASVPGAYGLALDGAGKAYVVSHSEGKLVAVDLQNGQKTTVATGLPVGVSAVALDGKGKAYVGQRDHGGNLYEVSLADGAKRLVTNLPGASTIRVELTGDGKAFTIDHLNGRLYEITLADGSQRVVASGLATCEGLALDTANGQIYVSNRETQLWQITQRDTQPMGGVGKVAA